jgi:hypothetical protein
MKKVALLIVSLFILLPCFSQTDTIVRPMISLRPYIECGVVFLDNKNLTDSYKTNTTYNWGLGLRIGNPYRNRIFPYFEFSRSHYVTQKTYSNNITADSILRIDEYIFGFNILMKRVKSNMLLAKVGYITSSVKDDMFHNSNTANGLQLGLQYEARFHKNSRAFINYSYDFLKLNKAAFRDYDIQKITFGIIL